MIEELSDACYENFTKEAKRSGECYMRLKEFIHQLHVYLPEEEYEAKINELQDSLERVTELYENSIRKY